ncbi:hypothetical protein [Bacillus toyonensis]|uniref:hypothetical protein n=1 Tax=Bacillus toyonensis TaxID=155322 RepID=UPI0015CF3F22|nr:hypothetical protein [Bacillus toyonensis]
MMNTTCKFTQLLKMICLVLIDGKRVVADLNTIEETNTSVNPSLDTTKKIS